MAKVVQPFLSGVTVADVEHKAVAGSEDVAKAVMVHLFTEAQRQWRAATSTPPMLPPGMLPAPAAPPAPAPATTSPDDRPPKHFAQWSAQVQAYEEKTVDGVKRVFPTEKLLGAEDVLARLWHEHTKTKEYKPLGLGEIVARRTWTAGMDLNTMAAGRSSSSSGAKAIKLIDGNLVTEDTDEWTPKGIMLTIDGIEASRWAWIICGFDEERRIDRFSNWFIERARWKQASIPVVQSYWADSMWKLCADMRRGLTFGEATDRIMKDTGAWNEHVIAHAAAAARQRPAPPTKESMGADGAAPPPDGEEPRKGGPRRWRPRRRPTAQTTTKDDGRDGQQQPPKGQTKGGGRDDTGSWKDHGGRGGHQQKDWNEWGGAKRQNQWSDQGLGETEPGGWRRPLEAPTLGTARGPVRAPYAGRGTRPDAQAAQAYPPKAKPNGDEVIVLSVFDGVGTAPWLVLV